MVFALGESSSLANFTGVVVSSWTFSSLSLYVQINSSFGEGGGPRVKVRMRWISRIIFSFASAVSFPALTSLRSIKASSRSLVVMSWLIPADACADQLSG